MDQLKTFVRQLIRYHFWVLSGVVTIFGVLIWYLAYSQLSEDYKKEEAKINTAYGELRKVLDIRNHPNDFSRKKMEESSRKTRISVNQAWTSQYQNQLTVLKWPTEILGTDFERAVEPLRPIEAISFPTEQAKEIDVNLRAVYQNYIKKALPKLATVIDAEWLGTAGGGGMMGGGAGGFGAGMAGGGAAMSGAAGGAGVRPGATETEKKHVVDWAATNQARIASRFDWTKEKDEIPKTLQILYAQEDYWVLDALLHIINQTNDGADARYKAAVKTIESIELGADVSGLAGQVARLAGSGGGGAPGMGGMSGMSGMGGMGAMGPPSGESGRGPAMGGAPASGPAGAGGGMSGLGAMGAMGGGGDQKDPAEFRYVDNELKPVDAKRLRDAVNQDNPKDAFLAVAKRMPVRLRLKMDLRKLNRLLAECGNSSLPVEIRQVRINKQGSGSGVGGGGGGGGAGGSGIGPSMGAMGAGAGASSGLGGMGGARGGAMSQVKTVESYDGDVELFGLVYLFNPPVRGVQIGTDTPASGETPKGPPPTTTGATSPNVPNTKS